MPFPVCHTVSLIILRFAGATGLHNDCACVDFNATAELTHHVSLNPECVSATHGKPPLLRSQNWVPGGYNHLESSAAAASVCTSLPPRVWRPGPKGWSTCKGMQPHAEPTWSPLSGIHVDSIYF